MKDPFFILKFLLIFFIVSTNLNYSFSAIGFVPETKSNEQQNVKQVEIKLERKLNFKERIAISIFKKKQKRARRKKAKRSGYTSSIIALIFGFLGFIPFLGILFSGASFVLGFKAFHQAIDDSKSKRNKILAELAIILGLIGFAFHIYFFAVLFP